MLAETTATLTILVDCETAVAVAVVLAVLRMLEFGSLPKTPALLSVRFSTLDSYCR